jgi:hypothetical protein
MGKDIELDYSDLILEATANVQSIMLEFQNKLAKPMMKKKFAEMWMGMPDEMKQKFASDNPEAYKALQETLT